MSRRCVIYSILKNCRSDGFFLLELQLSLFLTVLMLALLGAGMRLGWQSWTRLATETELRSADRYIISRIEKDIGLSATAVTIRGNTFNKALEIQTLDSKQVFRIYCEKRRLYRKILTRVGSGVNPLYINDISVDSWQLQPIDEKRIFVSYDLSKGACKEHFQRLIVCHNGIING